MDYLVISGATIRETNRGLLRKSVVEWRKFSRQSSAYPFQRGLALDEEAGEQTGGMLGKVPGESAGRTGT